MTNNSINNNILALPDELWVYALSFLDPRNLANCCRISKELNRLGNDPRLWNNFFKSANIDIGNQNAKKIFSEISIHSYDELIEKVKLFISKITLSSQREFNCLFLKNKCLLKIRVGKTIQNISENFEREPNSVEQEKHVFTKRYSSAPISLNPHTVLEKLSEEDLQFDPNDAPAAKEKKMEKLIENFISLNQGLNFVQTSSLTRGNLKGQITATLPDNEESLVDTIYSLLEQKVDNLRPLLAILPLNPVPVNQQNNYCQIIAAVVVCCIGSYLTYLNYT